MLLKETTPLQLINRAAVLFHSTTACPIMIVNENRWYSLFSSVSVETRLEHFTRLLCISDIQDFNSYSNSYKINLAKQKARIMFVEMSSSGYPEGYPNNCFSLF